MIEVSEKALGEFKRVLSGEDRKGLGIKIKAFMSESSCCSCGEPRGDIERDRGLGHAEWGVAPSSVLA